MALAVARALGFLPQRLDAGEQLIGCATRLCVLRLCSCKLRLQLRLYSKALYAGFVLRFELLLGFSVNVTSLLQLDCTRFEVANGRFGLPNHSFATHDLLSGQLRDTAAGGERCKHGDADQQASR